MINYARDHTIKDGLDYIAVWQTAMFSGPHMAEAFNIAVADTLQPRQLVQVTAIGGDGSVKQFETVARVDTPIEVEYLRNGGILHYVLRRMASA